MDINAIAACFAELGHPTRLTIFHLLVKAGPTGLSVGEIQQALGIPGSTLSHHISKLVKVDLVKQQRESRTLHCIPQIETLFEVSTFLQKECCIDMVDSENGDPLSNYIGLNKP